MRLVFFTSGLVHKSSQWENAQVLLFSISKAPFRLSTLSLKGKDSRTKLRILIQSFVLRSPFLGEMSEGQRGVHLFVVL